MLERIILSYGITLINLGTISNIFSSVSFLESLTPNSSIISRYIFLKEFDKLSKNLNLLLLKGASDKVDEIGVKIVNKYGFDKLNEIAKLNFKNTEKIKELISK